MYVQRGLTPAGDSMLLVLQGKPPRVTPLLP